MKKDKVTTKDNEKTLDITNVQELVEKVPDVVVFGDPSAWVCIGKASSKAQGWMKSTKVLELPHGCLVQVSTQQGDHVAEALTFVPGGTLRQFTSKITPSKIRAIMFGRDNVIETPEIKD